MSGISAPGAPSRQRTAEAAIILAVTRIASAVLGILIASLVAWRFGATPRTDAFFAAEAVSFRLAGWLGPVLRVSLIPGLTDIRLRRGEAAEREAAAEVLGASLPVFFVGTLLLVAIASPVMLVTAPGFDPEVHREATRLTRVLAPAFFLAGFFEFVQCVLNTHRHFAWPAVGRVLAKFGLLAGILWFAEPFGMMGLCIGVVLGNVLQLAPQLGLTARVAPRFWIPRVRVRTDLRPYIVLLGPALLWLAIDQVNVIVGQALASTLPSGKLSAISYAARLPQFAVDILVSSLVSASLPSFSEHRSQQQHEETRRLTAVNLRMVLFVTLPTMAGLIALRGPLVAAFFERGSFDPAATRDTSLALLGFAVGLAAVSINMVFRVALFTNQRMKTVLRVGALEIVMNAALAVVLMRAVGHWGIPLAASISATVASVLLLHGVEREFGRLADSALLRSLWKSAAATAVMVAGIFVLGPVVARLPADALPGGALASTGIMVVLGAAVYVGVALALRAEEMERVMKIWRRRREKHF